MTLLLCAAGVTLVLRCSASDVPPAVSSLKSEVPGSAQSIRSASASKAVAADVQRRPSVVIEDRPMESASRGLTAWGRELGENPGADVGLLYARFRQRQLRDPEYRDAHPLGDSRALSPDKLAADATLNPSGKALAERDRQRLQEIIDEGNLAAREIKLNRELVTCQVVERSILGGDAIDLPPMDQGGMEAAREFNRKHPIDGDHSWTAQPGATLGTSRRVVLTRELHPEFFGLVDAEHALEADLRRRYVEFFARLPP